MKKYIVSLVFFIIIIKAFSCEHLQEREFRGKFCKIANVFMDDTLQELVNGKKEFGEEIRGVVYFEGFDFPNYEAERLGIEPMLERNICFTQRILCSRKSTR